LPASDTADWTPVQKIDRAGGATDDGEASADGDGAGDGDGEGRADGEDNTLGEGEAIALAAWLGPAVIDGSAERAVSGGNDVVDEQPATATRDAMARTARPRTPRRACRP